MADATTQANFRFASITLADRLVTPTVRLDTRLASIRPLDLSFVRPSISALLMAATAQNSRPVYPLGLAHLCAIATKGTLPYRMERVRKSISVQPTMGDVTRSPIARWYPVDFCVTGVRLDTNESTWATALLILLV